MNYFYVYAYLRKDLTPYYIGKGQRNRMYDKGNHRIHLPVDRNLIKLIAHKLFENEAFILEKRLIKIYGRKDLGMGILRNLTNGGEGSSGVIPSKETRLKNSIAVSGDKNGMFGRTHSEDSITKGKITRKINQVNASAANSVAQKNKTNVIDLMTGEHKRIPLEEFKMFKNVKYISATSKLRHGLEFK